MRAGTAFAADYRVYYYFSVCCAEVGRELELRITNLSPIVKVYCTDLRPLIRVPSVSTRWERVHASRCRVELSPGSLQLTIRHVVGSAEPAWLALYYPFSYGDCQRLLRNIDQVLGTCPATSDAGAHSPATPEQGSPSDGFRAVRGGDPAADVYYRRELLVRSVEGRRVELLTVSSQAGRLEQRESALEGLFPEGGARPFRFAGKPIVWVSARVHPGETAASYAVHGLLALLLQPRNAWARALRNRFVFKIVPMLNPDGVARGHFRTDSCGVNLNRAFGAPRADRQPAVFATRAALRDCCSRATPLWCFLDLHGFTARQGCYLLGNSLPPAREARALVFSALLQAYAPQFNASACPFGRRRAAAPAPGAAAARTPSPLPAAAEEDGAQDDAFTPVTFYSTHPVGSALAEAEAAALAAARLCDPAATAATAATAPADGAVSAAGEPDALARLHEADHVRAVREWSVVKSRGGRLGGGAGGEAVKEGTARAWVWRELGCAHAYTVECSCNLLPHARVFARVYAGQAAAAAADPAARVELRCRNAEAALVSQVPPGAAAPLPAPAPPLSSRHRRRPYACQVDSLQPPREAPDYVAPLGFPRRPPAPGDVFHCPWGTCALDPPACFAAVGRGMLMALLDLAGGDAAVESRVPESPWRSQADLNAWARKVCRVPPAAPHVLDVVPDVLAAAAHAQPARARSEPAHASALRRTATAPRTLLAAARSTLSTHTTSTTPPATPSAAPAALPSRARAGAPKPRSAGLAIVAPITTVPFPGLTSPSLFAGMPHTAAGPTSSPAPGAAGGASAAPSSPPAGRRRILLAAGATLPPLPASPAASSRASSPGRARSSSGRRVSKSADSDDEAPLPDASKARLSPDDGSDPAMRLLRDLARLQAARARP